MDVFMPSFIYAAADHAVFINQFVQSFAQFNGTLQNSVRITQNNNYPNKSGDDVKLMLSDKPISGC